ncbi:dTDP-4-dehydrorhamnose reductase [Pedobacter steynii]|uniref:dTDP-4-dehydrorhamnose reductase n=1 Tax=Pedobacter steynii TaxID=430522 RepID=A0A1H0G8Y7_9SPHI|nr:SDR family oxidoreductase [Pedobacter steynii]NQX42354.1 SDR family oxidoreductase [Pedobacter steynii]SDO03284.1 dTDP-4-dehydrorhamnose reductase [Pedobacter steynii]
MKTILVTGSNGLTGQKITERVLATKDFNLIATSRGENRFPVKEGYVYAEMDILNPANVTEVVAKYKPDAIIHTAAMTNVDTCESQKELAHELNVAAVETLIQVCKQFDVQLIHLSTDFIFDGANGPYDEVAPACPLSYYGQTKLAAENAIIAAGGKWAILRTIIVYGIVSDMSRSNIVLWAKGALEKGEPINVVNDQWRMPTLAEDLADCCLLAVSKNAQGVYNASGKDMMSISELVGKVADYWNLDKSLIKEISAATLNQSAKRPVRTGFILNKTIRDLGYQPRSFQEGLAILDEQLKDK